MRQLYIFENSKFELLLFLHAHPAPFGTNAVFGWCEKASFNKGFHNRIQNRQVCQTIGKSPLSQQLIGNSLLNQSGKLLCNDLCFLVEIALVKTAADSEKTLAIFYGRYQNFSIKHIFLAVQIAAINRLCRMFFLCFRHRIYI